jgi:hypothetical protein
VPDSRSTRTKLTLADWLLWIALAAIVLGYYRYLNDNLPRGPLGRGPRGDGQFGTWIFAACLFLWSIARLQIRTKRSPLICRTCGRPALVNRTSKKTGLCPTCHLASLPPQARKQKVRGSVAILLGLCLLVSLPLALISSEPIARRFGWGGFTGTITAYAVAFLATSGLFFGFLVLTVWRANRRLRRPAALARTARSIVSEPGHTLTSDSLTAWWTGPEELGSLIERKSAEVGRRLELLLGPSGSQKLPISICGFAKRQDYVAFQRALKLVATEVDGIYLPGPAPTLLFTTESRHARMADTPALLAQLFTFHTLNGPEGLVGPTWLQLGLTGYVVRCVDAGGSSRVARAALAALKCGRTRDGDSLFRLNGHAFVRLVRDQKDHGRFVELAAIRTQACSLVDYLAGEGAASGRREAFRNYVADLRTGHAGLEALEQRLGVTPERLLSDWRLWVEQRGPGVHTPPGPKVRARIDAQLLPVVQDRDVEADNRISAIRDLGLLGHAHGASILIDVLDDPEEDPSVLPAVKWALETISGLGPVDSIDNWRAWFDTVPHEAQGTPDPDPHAPSDAVTDEAGSLAEYE